VILADSDLDVACERAEQLRQAALHLRVRHNDCTVESISLSLGIACTAHHGLTAASLIAAADQALYRAKTTGRNRAEVAPVGVPTPPSTAAA
jgi:diguanylate cyclase (GGDEF)-like protein